MNKLKPFKRWQRTISLTFLALSILCGTFFIEVSISLADAGRLVPVEDSVDGHPPPVLEPAAPSAPTETPAPPARSTPPAGPGLTDIDGDPVPTPTNAPRDDRPDNIPHGRPAGGNSGGMKP